MLKEDMVVIFLSNMEKLLKLLKLILDLVNKKKAELNEKILLLKKMLKKFLTLLIKKITNFLKEQKTIMNCMDQ